MSYWILALLAASAGALFGLARPEYLPWRRPHPVRGTIGFALNIATLLLLVGGYLLRWDEAPLARALLTPVVGATSGWLFPVVGVLVVLVAVWLTPGRSIWTRLALTLAFALAWLALDLWL
jgi:hypothetical protein